MFRDGSKDCFLCFYMNICPTIDMLCIYLIQLEAILGGDKLGLETF